MIILSIDFILHLSGINTQEYFQPRYYENNIQRNNLNDYSFTENFDLQKQKGLVHISDKRVIVLCLCRNVEGIIPHAFKNISNCVKHFNDYRVVLYENDSSDNTRKILKNDMPDKKWILLDCCDQGSCDCKLGVFNPKSHGALTLKRIEKMSSYRNILLNYTKQHYSDFDYVIVYDFDMRGGIFMDGFYQTFHNYQDWDAVACRGLKPFPFTYGLINCVHDAQAYLDKEGNDDEAVLKFLKQQYDVRNTILGDPYIKVSSAFNGLCIYKLPIYIKCKYSPGANKVLCEHIGLAEDMNNKGYDKIFINQALILQSGLESESMIPFYEYLSWFK